MRNLLLTFMAMVTISASGVDLPPNQWVPMNEPNVGVQLLGWDEIRYCPELEGFLFYGAYRSFTTENQNAVWLYRFKENRWRLLYTNLFWARSEMSSDGGHTAGKMFYDETRKVLVYGGLVSMSTNDRYRTWVFDPRALVGWESSPNPSPGIAYNAASAYIPDLKASFTYEAGSGAWLYDAMKNQWTQLSKSGNGPPPVTEAVYDAKRKRVICFGGAAPYYCENPKTFNDLWSFDFSSKQWQKLNQKNAPPARAFPYMALSPVADVVMLHGGFNDKVINGCHQQVNDTWILNLETLEWAALSPSLNPPPSCGYNNHLGYDPVNDVFIYVGGTSKPYGYSYSCTVYAMKYQGKNATKAAPPVVEPAPVYDPKSFPKASNEWAPLGAGVVSGTGGFCVRPSLASNGNELLLTFGEYEPPTKDLCDTCTVQAFRYAGGQWNHLGNGSVSAKNDVQAQTPSAAFDSAGKAVVAYNSCGKIQVKRFDNDWKPVATLTPKVPLVALPALAGNSSMLAVAYQYHPNGSCQDYGCGVYVSEDNGSEWKACDDNASVNVYPVKEARAQLASLLRDGDGRLVAAWQEQRYGGANTTLKRIYVRRMEAGKWAELGKEVPTSSPQVQANAYAIAMQGKDPVVAVCEATDGGHAQLFVYAWSGGAWSKLGDALNVLSSDGGAFRPAICSDGKSVFVAWSEYLPSRPPLLFVKKWDGSKWTVCGGPLNDAIGKGAATDPVMAILAGKPVVAWTEMIPCGEKMQQVFIKVIK